MQKLLMLFLFLFLTTFANAQVRLPNKDGKGNQGTQVKITPLTFKSTVFSPEEVEDCQKKQREFIKQLKKDPSGDRYDKWSQVYIFCSEEIS
jgi:hypothetical protein